MKHKIKKGLWILLFISLTARLTACSREELPYITDDRAEEEIYEIAIENVTLAESYPDTEKIEELINEITVPAIRCRVKIVNCYIGEHKNLIGMAAAGNEKLDIINTGLTTSLSELVTEGAVIPLDSLLEKYGKEILRKENEFLKVTTVNENVYAVSANLYPGRAMGIGYNSSMAKQYGIVFPAQITLESLTEIGAQLNAANPELYLTTQGDGGLTAFNSFFDIEDFGGNLNYGVVFDPMENTEIENIYESEEYRKYCHTLREWREKGYMPQDSLISGENMQEMFNEEKILFQWSSVSPQTKYLIAKKDLKFEEKLIAITPNRISTSAIQEFAWGISSASEHPEKAMELLNFIYSSPEAANLLQYGREGIEYEKINENTIRYADGLDANTVRYGSYFSIYGDSSQTYQFGFGNESTPEEIKEFAAQSGQGKTLGYVFQTDRVLAEIAAVTQVTQQYCPILETGMADDVDETLKEFQAALETAGIEKIIE